MELLQFLTIFAILVGIFGFPQNPTAENEESEDNARPWWKSTIIYQIYPRSFKDSDGDGTGDLKGITSKVDYLKKLGIGAVWLSPVYVSPMADFGYDIADFMDIDPIFGTLEDFDNLLEKLHEAGLKIIMDLVPNHTSEEHEWFQKSLKRIDPYTDYYVWKPAKGFNSTGDPIPPNNWLSVFSHTAWQWSEERQEFYLHQFAVEQPDLNFRNPLVLDEYDKIFRFWLDRGVDGFRVDAIAHMYEVEDYSLDEPVAANPIVTDPEDYEYLDHPYSKNRPETVEAAHRWRGILNEYGPDKLMVIEVYEKDPYNEVKYYGTPEDPIASFPFNMHLISDLHNRSDVNGLKLKSTIDIWLDNIQEGQWPNWVLGNHDRGRVATRLGSDLVDSLNMMSLLLKGTPTTYYGEEIGMENRHIDFDQVVDPWALYYGPDGYELYGRDPVRTPMQWDDSMNAGFSTANKTWLPVHENYNTVNVEAELAADQSHLKTYMALAGLRKNPTFTLGDMTFPLINENTFTFLRSMEGETSYLVIINTSTEDQTIDVSSSLESDVQEATVEIRSTFDEREETEVGKKIELSAISMLASEGMVLRL